MYWSIICNEFPRDIDPFGSGIKFLFKLVEFDDRTDLIAR